MGVKYQHQEINMLRLLVLVCVCFGYSTAVKVLVLPQNMNSHILYHARIAQLLANEGHIVEMILPSSAKIPDVIKGSGVGILWYQLKNNMTFSNTKEASQMISEGIMEKWQFQQLNRKITFMRTLMKYWDEECGALIKDESIRAHLSRVRYDIAIADTTTMKCHTSLLYSMDIPVVLFGIMIMDWILRVPSLPSFVPSSMSTFGDSMSFVERLQNTFMYIMNGVVFILLTTDSLPDIDPAIPVLEVFNRCELYLLLDDISISYSRPVMPNIVYIGDAIPQPGQALPDNIEEFVQSAQDGVILVSFGSYFDYLPPEVGSKLCSVFKRLPQKVIWKQKNKTLCDADPDRMLLLDWLPQNNLLSHSKVKLFISHCGMNSILESIYHSTPIIGFPTGIDQPLNARKVVNLGLGYEMNLRDFSADELFSKISDILSDETILRNVRRASEMMRNKPDKPEKRLSYWIEHVVHYGSSHLKTKAYELNTLQFYCLDVLLVIMVIVVVTGLFFMWCLKMLSKTLMNYVSIKQKFD